MGRPPQNREPTTNETTSFKTIHTRLPERHVEAINALPPGLEWANRNPQPEISE
jgi:hypothetical protein